MSRHAYVARWCPTCQKAERVEVVQDGEERVIVLACGHVLSSAEDLRRTAAPK